MANAPNPKSKGSPPAERAALTDPGHVQPVWASELVSIEIQGRIAILTFGAIFRKDGPDEVRQVCARIAMDANILSNIAWRIEKLNEQAKALESPSAAGNA